ncbi:MAG: hypothetical protein M3065_00110 [Actinomycetota bacterium]|nr:hypothetical protein [Actinomycetota bacterium]
MADAQRTLEDSARRIAQRGREALLERLRGAFEAAAAAHADVLELNEERLERMVQDAAERADGLQWRRALATVATEELGIGLGEALGHPAVARAQAIVGAPSYEEGLAAIAEGKSPKAGTGAAEVEDEGDAEAEAGERDGLPISVGVIHLDGWPELEGEGELELVFSEDGLQVTRAGDRDTLVSFTWSELRGVEVQPGRGRMRRRRAARLTLSTNRRRARFEARGVDPAELKERLAPALAKVGSEE